jgi:fucose permease
MAVVIVYGCALIQGLTLVTFPAAANLLTDPKLHGLTRGEYGALFLPMVLGAILASALGGWVGRNRGPRALLLGGIGFDALSMALLASSQLALGGHGSIVLLLTAAMAALGFGFGATVTSLNLLAQGLRPGRSATALTALHATLGIGTALAPLLLNFLLAMAAWWWQPVLLGGAWLVLAGGASALPTAGRSSAAGSTEPVPLSPVFRLFAALALLYGICETLYGNWGSIYLNDERGLTLEAAGRALAVFWGAVTAGRLLVSFLSVWLPVRWIYVALPALQVAALLSTIGISGPSSSLLVFGLAGLGCSAFLPLTISLASTRDPERAEMVSGLLMAAYMSGFGLGSFGVGPLQAAALPLGTLYRAGAAIAAGILALAWRASRAPQSRF